MVRCAKQTSNGEKPAPASLSTGLSVMVSTALAWKAKVVGHTTPSTTSAEYPSYILLLWTMDLLTVGKLGVGHSLVLHSLCGRLPLYVSTSASSFSLASISFDTSRALRRRRHKKRTTHTKRTLPLFSNQVIPITLFSFRHPHSSNHSLFDNHATLCHYHYHHCHYHFHHDGYQHGQ
jgi:hypothetical protein